MRHPQTLSASAPFARLPRPLRAALIELLGEEAQSVELIERSWRVRWHPRALATTRRNRIYLRGSSKAQVNIWCWPCGSGEVYGYRTDAKMPAEVRAGVTPKEKADKPLLGQWNRFVITMKGDRLTVDLNGKRVLDGARLPDVPKRGPIGLQHHGDPIRFANLYIRELDQ